MNPQSIAALDHWRLSVAAIVSLRLERRLVQLVDTGAARYNVPIGCSPAPKLESCGCHAIATLVGRLLVGIGVVPPSHALGDHGQANIESLWPQWALTQERPKSRPVACIGLSWCCAAQPLSEMSARLRLAGHALRRLLALRGVNVLQSCLEPFVLPWFPYRVVRVPPSEMLTIGRSGVSMDSVYSTHK